MTPGEALARVRAWHGQIRPIGRPLAVIDCMPALLAVAEAAAEVDAELDKHRYLTAKTAYLHVCLTALVAEVERHGV